STISLRDAVEAAVGQETRMMSAPASSQRRIWSIVALASSVGVLVIVWTLIGASPPTGTEPTIICRDLRRSISRQGRMEDIGDLSPPHISDRRGGAKTNPLSKGLSRLLSLCVNGLYGTSWGRPMVKLARLPGVDRDPEGETPPLRRARRLRTRFYAFLSYSHKDKETADWLHRELERFRVPGARAGKLTANGVVPRRLSPIFRDQQDLAAGDDLAEEIEGALATSQFLVVLCSPTAAKSRWTNLEIESFKRTRPEGCVLAAVLSGEPFASDIPGREQEECFPPALRFKYDRRGHRTAKRAEPLAADFRDGGGGRRLAFLKLVAGMLGVGLDELVQRETTRRNRRLGLLAAASLAGMAVTSTLAITAIQARDAARDQRREAEGLIGFMLGDLKDKLEPIGRLDAL